MPTWTSPARVSRRPAPCNACGCWAPATGWARTFIAEDQGSGAAGVGLLFFDTLDCSGRTSGVFAGPITTTTGAWVAVTGETPAPSSARSLLMRLLVQKPFAQSTVTAQFDDVLLQTL
jgi:hypothetical protein